MAIGTDTITVYQGEDVVLNFTMSPVEDITGWTLSLTVSGGGTSVQKAGVILSAASGTFKFTLTDTDLDLRQGKYHYDVWRTDDGSEKIIAVGDFIVSDAIRGAS